MYDRVLPKREEYSKPPDNENVEKNVKQSPKDLFEKNKIDLMMKACYQERLFKRDIVNGWTQNNQRLMGEIADLLVAEKQISPPLLLPFNLSFDMDGLSGMKMYEKFLVDDRVLPMSYGVDQVDLLVSGLNHQINTTSWTTHIDTQYQAKQPLDPVNRPPQMNSVETTDTGAKGGKYKGGGSSGAVKGKILEGDPQAQANPNGVGAKSYRNSFIWAYNKDKGYSNSKLSLTDKNILVFIDERSGCNSRYKNPKNGNKREYMLNPSAALAWWKWRKEMREKNVPFRVSSGYRNSAHAKAIGSSGGGSPHGAGGALDFGNLYRIVGGSQTASANLKGRKTETYESIATIGAKYGWYNPRRLSDNYNQEELWHFEYWGPVNMPGDLEEYKKLYAKY